jgi:hypothetical protein
MKEKSQNRIVAEKKSMRDKLIRARRNEFQKPRHLKKKRMSSTRIVTDHNDLRQIRDLDLIKLLTNSINKLEAELFT